MIYIGLAILLAVIIWLVRWAREADRNTKPPYGIWRRNAPWLIGTFFLLLLAALIGSDLVSETYTRAGISDYGKASYRQAEKELRIASNLTSTNPAAPYYLGLCLLHEGKTREALSEFEAARDSAMEKKFEDTADRQIQEQAEAEIARLHAMGFAQGPAPAQ